MESESQIPESPKSEHQTERLDARNDPAVRAASIARAADLLRAGATVAFPTETVYGLGANALDPAAIAKIFTAKQRPSWDPLIVHIADRAQLAQIATVPPHAERLIEAFWPGPLTLLLPRTSAIPDAVTAGRPLVGVRIPSHPIALELLRQTALPIAAPSANRFGHTSPTTAAHVLADLDTRIAAVLDAGPTSVGLESTVLDPNQTPMVLYRPGAITPAMIEEICGPNSVHIYEPTLTQTTPESLPSPGVGIRHYAPRARLLLVEEDSPIPMESGLKVGMMLPEAWRSPYGVSIFRWGPWDMPEILAQRLFAGLRYLDDQDVDVILCPVPPGEGIPAAIRDRLRKAARS